MKKRIIIISVAILIILAICGIVAKLFLINKNDGTEAFDKKEDLDTITKTGLEYIEEKYNKKFEIEDSGRICTSRDLFITYSEDVCIELKDGTNIIYLADEKEFFDDYQAEEIIKDIKKEIWKPLLKKMFPYELEDNVEPVFNFLAFEEAKIYGSFFNQYYDGNIEKFVKKEKIDIKLMLFNEDGEWRRTSELYLISEDQNSWQDRVDILKKEIDEKFDIKESGSFQITVLTSELYKNEVENKVYPVIDIDMDGCWATGPLSNLRIQE